MNSAILSPCEEYRYVLTRGITGADPERKMLFIMLNPSVADALIDDPTIRRCIGFARRENRGLLTVVNLFALRSTDPKALRVHSDPIGPENDIWIARYMDTHHNHTIVAAWGSDSFSIERGKLITKTYGPFKALGITRNCNPRHPLFVPANTEFIHYDYRDI